MYALLRRFVSFMIDFEIHRKNSQRKIKTAHLSYLLPVE